ncbi:MAG: phosphodiester glycosidase family protein, partial [Myxococcus sp.]|nr:phosphodiester glycosidase family protein [Myxococcus sp.]
MKTLLSAVTMVALLGCGPDAELTLTEAGDELATTSSELQYRALRPSGRSIHLAEVDLCEPGIELRATGPQDGTRTVSSFAARVGALIAINGGHSWSGAPSVSAHAGQFFGNPDQADVGQAAFGPGLAEFIPMRAAYAVKPGHREVLSGLLTLVHDGVAQHALLPHTEYTCSVEHPRTLLGLSADKRKLFMVVVDGRAPSAGRRGMTCRDAADFMVSLGAHWTLNLDGGGSSEMVVNGRIVNVPSDGRERPVPTHLAVVRTPGTRGHCPVAPPQPAPT